MKAVLGFSDQTALEILARLSNAFPGLSIRFVAIFALALVEL